MNYRVTLAVHYYNIGSPTRSAFWFFCHPELLDCSLNWALQTAFRKGCNAVKSTSTYSIPYVLLRGWLNIEFSQTGVCTTRRHFLYIETWLNNARMTSFNEQTTQSGYQTRNNLLRGYHSKWFPGSFPAFGSCLSTATDHGQGDDRHPSSVKAYLATWSQFPVYYRNTNKSQGSDNNRRSNWGDGDLRTVFH